MYTPKEVAENYLSTCRVKAALPLGRMFLLACLAGAFVALAGVASTAAAATVGDPSLAKLISGCVFPAGHAMVIVAARSPARWTRSLLCRSRCRSIPT